MVFQVTLCLKQLATDWACEAPVFLVSRQVLLKPLLDEENTGAQVAMQLLMQVTPCMVGCQLKPEHEATIADFTHEGVCACVAVYMATDGALTVRCETTLFTLEVMNKAQSSHLFFCKF